MVTIDHLLAPSIAMSAASRTGHSRRPCRLLCCRVSAAEIYLSARLPAGGRPPPFGRTR